MMLASIQERELANPNKSEVVSPHLIRLQQAC
jgi:hypothetical protein